MRRSDSGFLVVCVRRMGLKAPNSHPAREEFRIDRAGHVAADVVAPVGIADVGRGGSEPRLEGQRIPDRDGVAGEADLVAMIAEAAPAMEEQRPLALALLIGEVHVVEPPGRDSRPAIFVFGSCCQSSHQKSMPCFSSG